MLTRRKSLPNSSGGDYVELGTPRAALRLSAKWWRTPDDASMSSCAAERPSRLILTATEVTQEGRIQQRAFSREELIDNKIITPEEFRHMLLFGVRHLVSHVSDSVDFDDTFRRTNSNRKPTSIFHFRRGTLLLSIGSIRAIVEKKRMLVFERTDDATDFLKTFQESPQVVDGKFQLRCADQALLATIRKLDACLREVREVNAAVGKTSILSHVVRIRGMELEHIRQQRLEVLKCLGQASHVASILLNGLNDPDNVLLGDMEAKEALEWVSMLELYLQAFGECADECKALLDVIENCEQSAYLAMQERRLHIEEFELILVIAAVSVAAGAIVPGIWGMNLRSGYEESTVAFYVAIGVTLLVSITLFTSVRCIARYRGIFL